MPMKVPRIIIPRSPIFADCQDAVKAMNVFIKAAAAAFEKAGIRGVMTIDFKPMPGEDKNGATNE